MLMMTIKTLRTVADDGNKPELNVVVVVGVVVVVSVVVVVVVVVLDTAYV